MIINLFLFLFLKSKSILNLFFRCNFCSFYETLTLIRIKQNRAYEKIIFVLNYVYQLSINFFV